MRWSRALTVRSLGIWYTLSLSAATNGVPLIPGRSDEDASFASLCMPISCWGFASDIELKSKSCKKPANGYSSRSSTMSIFPTLISRCRTPACSIASLCPE